MIPDSDTFKVLDYFCKVGKSDYGARRLGTLLGMSRDMAKARYEWLIRRGWLYKTQAGKQTFCRTPTKEGRKALNHYQKTGNILGRDKIDVKHIEDKVTNAHCKVLHFLRNGPRPTNIIADSLKIARGTAHSQMMRMRDLGLLDGWALTESGKVILKRYLAGEKFSATKPRGHIVGHKTNNWLDRAPKPPPEWTHGIIYEDAKVRREVPKYVPHAASIPWKGKDSLAE